MSARILPSSLLREELLRTDQVGWSALAGASASLAPARNPDTRVATPANTDQTAFQAQLAAIQDELQRVKGQAEARAVDAYKAGFDDGFRKGLSQNQAELDSFRQQIASTLRSAELARREVLEQSDTELVKLSVAIAEKVLNRQIQIDKDALQGLVKAALERLSGKTVQCVRIHPEDRASAERELAQLGSRRAIRMEDDVSLARGAILFDTDYGTLDFSVSTQLEEIEKGLVDRLRRSGS